MLVETLVRWDDYKYAKEAEDFSLSLFPVLMVEKVTDKASATELC